MPAQRHGVPVKEPWREHRREFHFLFFYFLNLFVFQRGNSDMEDWREESVPRVRDGPAQPMPVPRELSPFLFLQVLLSFLLFRSIGLFLPSFIYSFKKIK